jgi:hypothetical protein
MAYDILLRRRTHTNWSMHSLYSPAFASCGDFAPDPIATTPEEQQYLAKLAVLKMSADAGNAGAQKEWKAAMTAVQALRKKAAKGDEKASRTVAILKESGIFSGVQTMSLGGWGPSYLMRLARDGQKNPQLATAVQKLHVLALRRRPPQRMLGALR